MASNLPPRHGHPRPYRPDTAAEAAERAGTRKGLDHGTIVVAPRVDGWVEVRETTDGWIELPILAANGNCIAVWDTEGLSRWMWGGTPRRSSLVARLRASLRPRR